MKKRREKQIIAAHRMVVNPRPVTISKVKREAARLGIAPAAGAGANNHKVLPAAGY